MPCKTEKTRLASTWLCLWPVGTNVRPSSSFPVSEKTSTLAEKQFFTSKASMHVGYLMIAF